MTAPNLNHKDMDGVFCPALFNKINLSLLEPLKLEDIEIKSLILSSLDFSCSFSHQKTLQPSAVKEPPNTQ